MIPIPCIGLVIHVSVVTPQGRNGKGLLSINKGSWKDLPSEPTINYSKKKKNQPSDDARAHGRHPSPPAATRRFIAS